MNETKTILGYEWCKPIRFTARADYVSIDYLGSWLAWCRVEQDTETGAIERVMMRPDDLEKADR